MKLLEFRGFSKIGSLAIDLAQPGRVWDLRTDHRAANMRRMLLSRSARRSLAGIASALLLMSQTVAAIDACAASVPATSANAAESPCHESGPPDGARCVDDGCQSHCVAPQRAPMTASVAVLVTSGLPAIHARLDQPLPGERVARRAKTLLTARAESPPLPIVLCCLRN